jgi:glycosyltransferase involved in cell wall biosynthesis
MQKKILYVFTNGRKERLNEISKGNEAPLEFLFGLPYLKNQGYSVDILELNDLRPDVQSKQYALLEKENTKINQRTLLTSSSHLFSNDFDKFNSYDLIIAGNEYIAFGLLHYIIKGILNTKMIFFVMGMMANVYKKKKTKKTLYQYLIKNDYRYSKKLYDELIQNSEAAIFIGIGEFDLAKTLFNKYKNKFHFLPFCTDTSFWKPSDNTLKECPYVLFMGNDSNRDYDLAIRIAKKLKQIQFKFITSRITKSMLPDNVELLAGDWKKIVYTDIQIREFIQNCSLIILPLKDSFQPSGQSVALQSMACGKTVVISKNKGFWDLDNFITKKHLVFVEQNNVDDWIDVILNTLNDNNLVNSINANARELVETDYNLVNFGRQLEKIIRNQL